jgi:hypothetical protein
MASNSGKATDSAGNVQVDFVWGNMPRQPNDVRTLNTDTNVAQDGTGKRLLKGKDNHDTVYSGYAGYPSFSTGGKDSNNQYQGDAGKNGIALAGVTATTTATQATVGSYNIVVASAAGITVGQGAVSVGYIPVGAFVTAISGTTVTLSQSITAAMSSTSLTFGTDGTWAYTPYLVVPSVLGGNGTSADLGSVTTTATQATVGATNIVVASATGIAVGQQVSSLGYIATGAVVLAVNGTTISISQPVIAAMSATAVAFGNLILSAFGAQDGIRDNGYTSTITVGTAVTNTALAVSAIARTAGTTSVTVTTATNTYAAGQAFQILGANATTEFQNNFYIATAVTTTSVTFTTTATTAVALSALTGVTIKGVTGSVATQSVAAGAASIDGTAGITIALWA